MKRSVVINDKYVKLFLTATDEQAGQLLKAMLRYQSEEDPQIEDPMMAAVFEMIKETLDDNNEKYEKICEARKDAANKRWNASECKSMQKDANASTSMHEDADKDLDKDILASNDAENKKRTSAPKHKYGEYQHVLLTDDQYEKLVKDYGEDLVKAGIKMVDEQVQLKGTKYKDHNLAIRKWGIDAAREPKAPPGKTRQYHNRYNDFPQRDNDYDKIQEDWIRKSFGT